MSDQAWFGFPPFDPVVLVALDEESGRWEGTHFAVRGDSTTEAFASIREALTWARDRCPRLELVDPLTQEVSAWPDDLALDDLEDRRAKAMEPTPEPTLVARLQICHPDLFQLAGPDYQVSFFSGDNPRQNATEIWDLRNTDVPAVLQWAAEHARGRITVIHAVLRSDDGVQHVRLAGIEPHTPEGLRDPWAQVLRFGASTP